MKATCAPSVDGDPVDMVDGEKSVQSATGSLKRRASGSPRTRTCTTVYTILKVDGRWST